MLNRLQKLFVIAVTLQVALFLVLPVMAASPSGADWFQLRTNAVTGGDNTGDGNGLLNYYYVGQQFTTRIEINSGGTSAANIWIDYNSATATPSGLTTGTYFGVWSNQNIYPNDRGVGLGRIYSTGYNIPITQSSGAGTFGVVTWNMNRPSEFGYGSSSPEVFDINIGNIGSTTESNISFSGIDILDDAEDFQFYIWADTIQPYAQNPSPSNGLTGVLVDSNFAFELFDSLKGEGFDTGVGTGVDITNPPGDILVFDGFATTSYATLPNNFDSYACSGVWGTNWCDVTVNPTSPLGISGDSRNWEYGKTYRVTVTGFQDLASPSQDQLGDTNGPNVMNDKIWNFTTEVDNVAPIVSTETPLRASTGVSVSSDIVIDVVDKKSHPGTISGSGLASTTCKIDVSSPTHALKTYTHSSSEVVVTSIDYGNRFTINPSSDFGQNETVSVRVYDCQDLATVPNVMVDDSYTFLTADTDMPYVDEVNPANDAGINANGVVVFHIKDSGTGINLVNTIVYVNGVYYTNTGGAGAVTTNGTRITFGTSLNFNGGNYAGDTTGITGTANDYAFTIDPQGDFSPGEAVPVLIYTRDTSGNIMEREVYALVVGGSCVGSAYCGANTSWDGLQCIGSGGGGGGICPTCPTCDVCETCDDCPIDNSCPIVEECPEAEECPEVSECEESVECEACQECEETGEETIECEEIGEGETCPECTPDEVSCPVCDNDGNGTDNSDGVGGTSGEYPETCPDCPCLSQEPIISPTTLSTVIERFTSPKAISKTVTDTIYKVRNAPIVVNTIYKFKTSAVPSATSKVVAGTYASILFIQFASMLGSISQIPYMFFNLFNMLIYKRRKRRGRGVVYDSSNGQPVSMAKITVFGEDGKVKETKVSDKYGNYFFLVPEGRYTVVVQKKGYAMIGRDEAHKLSTVYNPIYTKDEKLEFHREGMIDPGIPMKQDNLSRLARFFSKSSVYVLLDILFWGGFLFSILVAFFRPTIFNYVICGVYTFLWLLRLANFARPKWGIVRTTDGNIQAFSFVQAIDKTEDRMVGRAVTDQKGRYAFILGRGKYDLEARTSIGQAGNTKIKLKDRKVVAKDVTIK